ncbi:MAG TPA: hypothetical protein VNK26_08360, partial [Pyrinomonadaceae bacterium]|nr:hypothetical protein [Pyrinomonadaceae bacterium]
YKAGEPGLVFGRARKGRTTEGTLGRIPSTVANRARRSVGGGVLINIIKLADFSLCTFRAKDFGNL